MARKARQIVPFGYYHLVARGNNRQPVFDDWVRERALARLGVVAADFEWQVLAWALMTNHVHLVLRIGEGGLSEGMRALFSGVAHDSNRRFGRINHCFGQRCWSSPLETDGHLLGSIRYALWNPMRAGVGRHPADSSWTSFRASIGLDPLHPALASSSLLDLFGRTPERGRRALRRFIWDGHERCLAPWKDGAGILT